MPQGKAVIEVDVAISYQCKSGVGSDLRFPFSVIMSRGLLGCLHSPVQVLSGTGPVSQPWLPSESPGELKKYGSQR